MPTIETDSEIGPINYSWASRRLDGAIWGIATGDVDGDGAKDVVLLERKKVRIGRFEGDEFVEAGSCDLEGLAEGARVYVIDLDGDGDGEIVVSAVEEGMPASTALDFEGGVCITMLNRVRYSLRVIEKPPGRPALIGQGSTSQSFFSGPVLELTLGNGGLKEAGALGLPGNIDLYEFALIPSGGGAEQVALLKGYAPMEAVEKRGKRFKRFWKTVGRMGGSVNLIHAEQRQALDEVSSFDAAFDAPPLVVPAGDAFEIVALRHDMPLKGVIGKRPMIQGAEIVAFRPDPVLGFVEASRTIKLPGAVSDFMVEIGRDGSRRILALMLEDPGMFHEGATTLVLSFELP